MSSLENSSLEDLENTSSLEDSSLEDLEDTRTFSGKHHRRVQALQAGLSHNEDESSSVASSASEKSKRHNPQDHPQESGLNYSSDDASSSSEETIQKRRRHGKQLGGGMLENLSGEASAAPAPQLPPACRQDPALVADAALEAERDEAEQSSIGPPSQGKQQRGKVLGPKVGGTGYVVVGAEDPSESADRVPDLEKRGGDDSDHNDDDSDGGGDSESGPLHQLPPWENPELALVTTTTTTGQSAPPSPRNCLVFLFFNFS